MTSQLQAAPLNLEQNPFTQEADGDISWTHEDGDIYLATGTDPQGRRIKTISSSNWRHIQQINLYNGNKWLLRRGKRYLIQKVIN